MNVIGTRPLHFNSEPKFTVPGMSRSEQQEVTGSLTEVGYGSVLFARVTPPVKMNCGHPIDCRSISNIGLVCSDDDQKLHNTVTGYGRVFPDDASMELAKDFYPVYDGLERLVVSALAAFDFRIGARGLQRQMTEIVGFHLCLLFVYLDRRILKLSQRAAEVRPEHAFPFYGTHERLSRYDTDAKEQWFSRFYSLSGSDTMQKLATEAVSDMSRRTQDSSHTPMGVFLRKYMSLVLFWLMQRLPDTFDSTGIEDESALRREAANRARSFADSLQTPGTLFQRKMLTCHPWSAETIAKLPKSVSSKLQETVSNFMAYKDTTVRVEGPQKAAAGTGFLPYLVSGPFLLDQIAYMTRDHSTSWLVDSKDKPWIVVSHRARGKRLFFEFNRGSDMTEIKDRLAASLQPPPHPHEYSLPMSMFVEAIALYQLCLRIHSEQIASASQPVRKKRRVQDERSITSNPFVAVKREADAKDALPDRERKSLTYNIRFVSGNSPRTKSLACIYRDQQSNHTPWSHTGDPALAKGIIGSIVAILSCVPSNPAVENLMSASVDALMDSIVILLCSANPRSAASGGSVHEDKSDASDQQQQEVKPPVKRPRGRPRKRALSLSDPSALDCNVRKDATHLRSRIQLMLTSTRMLSDPRLHEPLLHNRAAIHFPVVTSSSKPDSISFHFCDVELDGRFSPCTFESPYLSRVNRRPRSVERMIVDFGEDSAPLPPESFLRPFYEEAEDDATAATESLAGVSAMDNDEEARHRLQSQSPKPPVFLGRYHFQLADTRDSRQALRLIPVSSSEMKSDPSMCKSQEIKGYRRVVSFEGRTSACAVYHRLDTPSPTDFELDLIDRQMNAPFIGKEDLFQSFLLLQAMTGSTRLAHWHLRTVFKSKQSERVYARRFHESMRMFYNRSLGKLVKYNITSAMNNFIARASEQETDVSYSTLETVLIRTDSYTAPLPVASSSSSSSSSADSPRVKRAVSLDSLLFHTSVAILAPGKCQLNSSRADRKRLAVKLQALEESEALITQAGRFLNSPATINGLARELFSPGPDQKETPILNRVKSCLQAFGGSVQPDRSLAVIISFHEAVPRLATQVPNLMNHLWVIDPELIASSIDLRVKKEKRDDEASVVDAVASLLSAKLSASGPSASHIKLIAQQLFSAL
jgi:hypothetical protein